MKFSHIFTLALCVFVLFFSVEAVKEPSIMFWGIALKVSAVLLSGSVIYWIRKDIKNGKSEEEHLMRDKPAPLPPKK